MKVLFFISLLAFSVPTFALEDISGNWNCYNDSGAEFTFDFKPTQGKAIIAVNGTPQEADGEMSYTMINRKTPAHVREKYLI